jgi:hypothetical protein
MISLSRAPGTVFNILGCGTCAVFLLAERPAKVRTACNTHGLPCLSSLTEKKIFQGNQLVRDQSGSLRPAIRSTFHRTFSTCYDKYYPAGSVSATVS